MKKWFDEKPILALAPMADMTDSPFCRVCREVSGSEFIVFREMVSSEALIRGSEKTIDMAKFHEKERPIVLQIFGGNPDVMRRAGEMLFETYKPDGIDINMGCPVPKIAKKSQAGASLMKDQDRAIEIVMQMKKIDANLPLSVKTRLGWSREDEILEFAPKLEQAGAQLLSVHGRTKAQGYAGEANWEMIGKVKQKISIPVIANGDIKSREDIRECLDITKADGVMIGRGSLGNPWIFQDEEKRSIENIIDISLYHAKLHLEHYGSDSIVTFRKHLVCYFKSREDFEVEGIKKLRSELVRINSIEELENKLKSLVKN